MPRSASPLSFNYFFPLSGSVTEDIHPVFYGSYRGSLDVETAITERVASPGRQIGIILDALSVLVGDRPGDEFEELRTLAREVNRVKAGLKSRAGTDAYAAVRHLASVDPRGFDAFAASFLRKPGGPTP